MLPDTTQEMTKKHNLQKSFSLLKEQQKSLTFYGRCKEIRAVEGNEGKGDAVQVTD